MNDFLRRVHDGLHQGDRKRPWLAERIGVSSSTVNGWFKNDRIPRVDEAVRIARALGTTVEYLVTGEEPPVERLSPDIAEICRVLQTLSKEQLAEIRGVVRAYVDHHFNDARAADAQRA